jgi:hypothetical protein
MQSHFGSVVLCLISTCVVGFKVLRNFLCELWWKCATSAECKTDRSAVLTVKSGLDPHMINELKDGFNIAFWLFLWPCSVPTISVLILAYAVQRRTPEWSTSSTTRSSEDAINQSEACGRWRWSRVFIVIAVCVNTFVSTLVSVIKVNKLLCTFWAMSCDITLMCLSYVWNCDPGTHMRCIWFSSENGCDRVVSEQCWL